MPNYYDWKGTDYTCGKCGLRGKGAYSPRGEIRDEGFEACCFKCGNVLAFLVFPPFARMKTNLDRPPEVERAVRQDMELRSILCERDRLRDPSQLPEIDEPSFILHFEWDNRTQDEYYLIMHGDKVLFREFAWYEDYIRFVDIAEIVRARYGERVRDLVPMPSSHLTLGGDALAAFDTMEHCRKKIFGPQAAAERANRKRTKQD